MKPQIYLDHQTTSPMLPEVVSGMMPWLTDHFGSPASIHQLGLKARDAIKEARQQVAQMIHAEYPEELIFTSGGTEAANLAIKGIAEANHQHGRHLVVSSVEHPAILHSVHYLEQRGYSSTQVGVDRNGRVNPQEIAASITPHTTLVAIQLVNQDVGTLQPIPEIGELTRKLGIPLVVDGSVGGGWIPIDVDAMKIDLLTLAPHRFFGPKGVGILYKHRAARMVPLLHGGVQEQNRRAGTENVAAIVGAGIAAAIATQEMASRQQKTTASQGLLWHRLSAEIPYTALNGPPLGNERMANNLNISCEFCEGEGLALMSDIQGVSFASGTACVTQSLKVSHVLTAIGLPRELALASIILSPGMDNSQTEIETTAEILTRAVQKLRSMSPSWDAFQQGQIPSTITQKFI